MVLPKPIKANVIILPLMEEQVSSGGILLVTNRCTAPPVAVVISVGPLVNEVAEGDHVYYNEHATKSAEHEGQTYLILNVHEILAKITTNDSSGNSSSGS